MRSPVERSMTMSLARRQHRRIVAPVTRGPRLRAEISRRTSAWRTCAPAIVAPRIVSSRSRAIVSVSGSSGIAGELSPADVRAELATVESHQLSRFAASLRSLFDVGAEPGHGEHAPAGDPQHAL